MSVVKNKNKNNIKHEQLTTINKEKFRRHITENIGLTEQQKIVMVRDRSTPKQDMSPERLTQPKKKYIFLIKSTLQKSLTSKEIVVPDI